APRRVTNPDATRNDHRIKVRWHGTPVWAIPVLIAGSEAYDLKRGGLFFDQLAVRYALKPADAPGSATDAGSPRPPEFAGAGELQGLYEQIGRNTEYTIHPEEILADNFALLILGKTGLPDPAIPQAILKVLKPQPAVSAPSPAAS